MFISGEFYANGIFQRKGQKMLQVFAENVDHENPMTIYHSIDGQEFEKVTTITDTLK
jgi:hypothetical protein